MTLQHYVGAIKRFTWKTVRSVWICQESKCISELIEEINGYLLYRRYRTDNWNLASKNCSLYHFLTSYYVWLNYYVKFYEYCWWTKVNCHNFESTFELAARYSRHLVPNKKSQWSNLRDRLGESPREVRFVINLPLGADSTHQPSNSLTRSTTFSVVRPIPRQNLHLTVIWSLRPSWNCSSSNDTTIVQLRFYYWIFSYI